jgi:hypothetical protein
MRAGKAALAVVGTLVALVALGLVTAGSGLLWAYVTQRDVDGFFTSPTTTTLSTDGYGLVSTEIDLGSRPGDWFPSGRLATVRLGVEPRDAAAVFVGIGPVSEVDAYLEGVDHAQVSRIGPGTAYVTYRTVTGEEPSTPPSEQTFWAASTEGSGPQRLTWDLEPGEWTVVIMNADASPGVSVEASASARTDLILPVSMMLLLGGLILAGLAAAMLVIAVRRPAETPGRATPVGRFDHYPVRLEGKLDSELSRWQWLIKWILVIPHLVVLAFLWVAFAVLTMAAGLAILFTGRYPKPIFNFNVGVMRWTWRVGYYSYSVLGTDQYPPFTLGQADYPASFDVAYPQRLSRGLVLVKWWLLAIPHYLIIGLFTSGLVWWSTELNESGNAVLEIGGGIIGILVLIAAVALAFTGRYPPGLFDLVMGLNRWVYRVLAYAALMRDEYPPFRLDAGGSEPGTIPPSPLTGPFEGGALGSGPDLSRV